MCNILVTLFSLALFATAGWAYEPGGMYPQKEKEKPSFQPGNPICDKQIPAAYPQGAAYVLDKPDVFVTVDYILWRWEQLLMPVNIYTLEAASSLSDQFVSAKNHYTALNPVYQSGFKVGAGYNICCMDDWTVFAEYTWYQNKVNSSIQTGSDQAFRTNYGRQFSDYFQQGSLNSHATLHFSSLDVLLKRTFYAGKCLVAMFGSGLKNIWITEKITNQYNTELVRFFFPSTTLQGVAKRKESSWGIGPKFAFEGDFLFGYGIKFLNSIAASFLYTQYISPGSLSGTASKTTSGTLTNNYSGEEPEPTFLPVTEASMGFGWGTYLWKNAFHIDLEVVYDVNIFWNYSALFSPSGRENMTLHGLDFQARFDF